MKTFIQCLYPAPNFHNYLPVRHLRGKDQTTTQEKQGVKDQDKQSDNHFLLIKPGFVKLTQVRSNELFNVFHIGVYVSVLMRYLV
ncbi:MAG: hypothetical protein DWQ44_11090 [Bacteroidetes bacterium]|nr:MAG: hypothetical protein DWQ33_09210 [Bacteroidota bacterium]REK05174.1 MAG: hypothetical protein DWQ39_08220 [Bacteroidota bacterium]REK32579.1 MAG: hypothetical protein DWQ44_11090 [Bacteroidota bacterium]REK48974.1 MAG: hypothetical protein DWQ48_08870 [Bacteroidota bacterium]